MLRFNDNNEVLREDRYNAIIVGVQRDEDIEYSMEELARLVEAAGASVLGQMVQKMEKPNTATLIGKGKVEELAELVKSMEADMVVFNDELTGMQLRNLEDSIGVRVIDRPILILDIFASRATSREGKLQVELAQLKYRLPRRHIERRMNDIREEIAHLKSTRSVQRAKREKSSIPVVALVGYTNSGKSALMNRLLSETKKEEKSVFEKNMLFATLDVQQRSVTLESGRQFILIDTVGFVSKLPHSLIEAFKATLEEVTYADLLLHVVDASYENHDFHINVTDKVMEEIGAGAKEKIMVYNKTDLPHSEIIPVRGCDSIEISAKYGNNIDKLIEKIEEKIFGDYVSASFLIPYERGDLSSYLCSEAEVKKMDYRENGTYFETVLKEADYRRLKCYEIV